MKKCIAILAAVVTMFSVSGCGGFRRGTGTEQLDPNRDWIYVGNYNGGLGSAWLQAVIDEFMAENPTWGVWIDNDKDLYNDGTLYDNIATNRQALYFVNGITYQNYVAGGKLAEITDIVTENLPGEEESIEDKMNDTLRDYYKTGGGQYYAVPFFDAPFGTVYDVDLFEEEYLYFDEAGRMICDVDTYFDASGNLTQPLDELKSAGPDGDITTTFDNGLPATYDQWTKLLQTMQSFGITPYIWTGEYVYYRYRYLASIWADYEGKEAFDLNSSFAGYYTFPGDSEPTKIELSNGYRLQEQPGKKYALDMGHYIIQNGYYAGTSFDGTNTHTMAQNRFLLSAETGSRIGMILEGAWWENEAKDYFATMAREYDEKYAFGTRRFGYMPVPKSDVTKVGVEPMTMISSTGNSVVCMNANVSDKDREIATAFLKFVHSDEALRTFTRYTGAIRPYEYELNDTDRAEMSYFALQMWDLYHAEDAQICYVTLNDPIFSQASTYLGADGSRFWWQSKVGNQTYVDALYEFSENSNLTAEQYWEGQKTYYSESSWKSNLS